MGDWISGWAADGSSGSTTYQRQFRSLSGDYMFRQYNCVTQRAAFYNVMYREKACVYYTCNTSSWYMQRVSGPNYREGLLHNGMPVRF